MPKKRPPTSGYARIAQAEEDEDDDVVDSDEEDPYRTQASISNSNSSHYAPIQPKRQQHRMQGSGPASPSYRRGPAIGRQRSNSGVDIKAINARLERWADEIAQKFKIRRIKGKSEEEEQLEIHYSVFQAPDWIRPVTAEALLQDEQPDPERLTRVQFEEVVESVRTAIELGVHPKLISQGSSGSYFARNAQGKVVGVFKPKDEEPYASKNPKWTKWIHRNLFPFFFGRACLIPNLSYVSEAAAYVLDTQLRTNIVPYTDIVSLSSKSFHYDFWDRRAYYRKKKAFPAKVGSFQAFLKGYKDATLFLKEHPWPDQQSSGLRTNARKTNKRRWAEECRPGGSRSDDEDEDEVTGVPSDSVEENQRRRVFWTDKLQQSFREQLERLVILDYIMRNTDRGLDNWMIRIDRHTEEASIVAEPPKGNGEVRETSPGLDTRNHASSTTDPYTRRERMTVPSRSRTPGTGKAEELTVSLGAIDNSLSWPWKHPDAWRSYPFGWLFLPVSLIGQPFSEATRRHFLPLLTSKQWWSETQLALRRCFSQDDDFKERMYARQIAVVKGQAWNVVETLKTPDHGPLELTRRARVHVWDDLVDIPVAVPLRVPSAEMRRRAEEEAGESGSEADIGAVGASAPPAQDLLGLSSPTAEGGNPFNVSRQSSSMDIRRSEDQRRNPLSSSSVQMVVPQPKRNQTFQGHSRTRMSYEGPRRGPALGSSRHQRRFSFSTRRTAQPPYLETDDNVEGDLGYAATEDREANQRRVIVERLETVKSKNPVFTWC
ncbi:hypothetical protein EJ05DRAFT_535418 [Pseudovirgaria hyperparasitica]|uniref:Phosphatidylinositol 4-kinase n=1 Tax=Pseudovirgaria hyperparasitica TaxID=470096 RepID=A0A6A6WK27_9PEZI|nr:uncharacterized protein EJ05DRAFT_535418 [Pseudovirgaria hyperparasitica]KAF2762151.1 hypothetical protein EJ05DRAFT_535418 [Pseudovirgaria hyperparasitica]